MIVEKWTWITRDDVRANPNKIFLFGDNLEKVGMGGQAGAMRGEPNAIGIPTKKTPSMDDDAFFTDDEYNYNCSAIDAAINDIWYEDFEMAIVVIPADGLGTGLAALDTRAPRTFKYLQQVLANLENVKN